jgi:hypothetical protein
MVAVNVEIESMMTALAIAAKISLQNSATPSIDSLPIERDWDEPLIETNLSVE